MRASTGTSVRTPARLRGSEMLREDAGVRPVREGYETRRATPASDRGPARGGSKDELVAELRSSVAFLLSVAAILVLICILEISLS